MTEKNKDTFWHKTKPFNYPSLLPKKESGCRYRHRHEGEEEQDETLFDCPWWICGSVGWQHGKVGREAEHGKGAAESCLICEQRFCVDCTDLCSFRKSWGLYHHLLPCSVGKYAREIVQTWFTAWWCSNLSALGHSSLTLSVSFSTLWWTHVHRLGSFKCKSESGKTGLTHHLSGFLK